MSHLLTKKEQKVLASSTSDRHQRKVDAEKKKKNPRKERKKREQMRVQREKAAAAKKRANSRDPQEKAHRHLDRAVQEGVYEPNGPRYYPFQYQIQLTNEWLDSQR